MISAMCYLLGLVVGSWKRAATAGRVWSML